MKRMLIAAILSGILLAPLAVEADARPIVVQHGGWGIGHHHGWGWGGPRWAPVVGVPFLPAPVLLPPPLVVPAVQYVPVAVPQPVAVPVPAAPVVPSGCGC